MSERLLIGVDGGGTHCRARIRDGAGKTLGEGNGGPANVRLDPALVMNSILSACRQAAAAAGLTEGDFARADVGLGLAGAILKDAPARLLAEPHPFGAVTVETDAYAAWLGAHGGNDGAILILGTGSCGLAVVGGEQHYVGGWGPEISDEGSGATIGREAIRRALWAHDGRAAATPLSHAVLARFHGRPEEIVDFVTTARPGDFASLVPLVVEHERARDPIALAVISDAAAGAAALAARLIDVGAPSICLIGGLRELYARWLPPPIRERLAEPQADALDGAIMMARRALAASSSAGPAAGTIAAR